ncbi:HPr-like protein Crh [Methylacidimicrobium cyclopophantes]|uniref:HPr-like protein Crh n=1 Tax=Methylacidimicrobium cyclopophantes TaxID=1041766 RepID=A0A5E6MLP3_9BACT|nr:HPr family phosphocarrier protein [Methylacidimicrobium cyclopophantes]VVM06344.1 HPr-like protein Crh [Methylacidimicrobium cyclopophantes]
MEQPSGENRGKEKGAAVGEAEAEVVIRNKLGLHARPAAMFVKVANRFSSNIQVEKEGEVVNGKSIMGIMILAANQGSRLKVSAKGPDAAAAVDALRDLVERNFDQEG